MVWIKWIGISLGALILLAAAGIIITQRVSDGPIEFLQGGPFRTGEVVETPVTDWSFGVEKPTEFELVGPGTSRTAGYIMHEGKAYMTCDLGFIWNRFEPGIQRHILQLIYLFKDWHLDAVEDGRTRLRIDGKIYRATMTRVEDPALIGELKAQLEALATEFIGEDIGPAPKEPPNDIWFFRLDSGW